MTHENFNWITRPFDAELIERLSRESNISPVLAQTLAGRGVTDPEQIERFLAPPSLRTGLHAPEKLPGCVRAAKALAQAIREQKRIVVYGDYDVDGMTATAILLQGIKILGGSCRYYVPNRLEEGYGLNCDTLERLHNTEQAEVIVTVDCGVTSLKEVQFANDLGMEAIVTDHHTPITDEQTGRQRLPEARAIVHPNILGEDGQPYPFPEICGAFVAFKLAWALGLEMSNDDKTAPEMRQFLLSALGLAALGTIADVMPLLDENRTLVRYALDHSFVNHMPLGLQKLAECALPNPRKRITSETVGFTIAPRLNAAGREVLNEKYPQDEEDQRNWELGKTLLSSPHRLAAAGHMGLATLGVELLITDDVVRAGELAPYINNLNATRQKVERKILSEALKEIEERYQDAPAFVLASRQWHPGVIGVVAGRLAEKFNRPTIMISLQSVDSGAGSGRSVCDFNLYDALSHCSDLLTRFGGHAAAAGLGIKESNLEAFREKFCEYVAENIDPASRTRTLMIDGEFPLAAITRQTLYEIEKAAPFGSGNPSPIFAAHGVSLVGQARRAGGKPKPGAGPDAAPQLGSVFQARFRQFQDERRAVAFKSGDWVDEINAIVSANPTATFDIAFQVVYNDYIEQVELRLKDWRQAQA
ncbi:MAG: DHHA1 domain-containing protein [Planctomycetia bacterium]|nr:DHHA1 domain-containing protein [Planctomycetia bacterium]